MSSKFAACSVAYTAVFQEEVSEKLAVGYGSADDRHRQTVGGRDIGDRVAFAGYAAAQRETLSGFLEHGVRVAGLPLAGGATSASGSGRRQLVREVDQGEVEPLAGQGAQPPRGHVRAAVGLGGHDAGDDARRLGGHRQRIGCCRPPPAGAGRCPTSSARWRHHCTSSSHL